jgi:hypothetical protein
VTREEAIKICTREKECVQGALDACADGGHYVSPDGVITALDYVEALDMAIAALREQEIAKDTNVLSNCCKNGNSWISVEDEKPKYRGHYFIAYKFADSDMRFYGEDMWHDDIPDNGFVQGDHFANEGVDGMYVTHWMEIPQLPEPPEVEV